MTFKIALVQFCPHRKDIRFNLEKVDSLLNGISADLIVLPELANTGYLYENKGELLEYAEESNAQGPFLSGLISLAGSTDGVIVCGYAERENDNLYNSAVALSLNGVIANYRKTHLFSGEKALFSSGNSGFSTFTFQNVSIGMMICFDWIFPESARTLSLMGSQIIAHPANLVMPYCQDAMITRSIENKVFTITANRIGEETLNSHVLNFTGGSQITSPSGQVIFRASKDTETVHVATINPKLALDKQISAHNDLIDDRRPEYYLF